MREVGLDGLLAREVKQGAYSILVNFVDIRPSVLSKKA
jgi:hypothetical protein